jgi:CRISPR type I-E-associated protein CasB/Cse2
MTEEQEPTRDRFFRWLYALVNEEYPERGALAALRRGSGKAPGLASEMYPLVEPHLWPGDDCDTDAAYRVAAIFAHLHQSALGNRFFPAEQRHNRSFGASLRIAASEAGEVDAGVERRFVALLDTRLKDIDQPMRQLVSLMKARAKRTPVDFPRLYDDLRFWGASDRNVQRRWAQDFWRPRGDGSDGAAASSAAAASTDQTTTDDDDDN